mgnify:CR=1 FL=1
MPPSIEHIEEIRYAASKLLETIDVVEPNQPLSTSQIISLYFWLIDHENIKRVKPIRSLIEVLMPCLEDQVIDKQRMLELQTTCQKIIGSRDSENEEEGGVAERQVMFF